MAKEGKIQSLYMDREKNELIFPRTKIKAISDDNGVGLDALLEHNVYSDPFEVEIAAAPINTDTLGGLPAADYATKVDLAVVEKNAAPAGFGYGETMKVIDEYNEGNFNKLLDLELAGMKDKMTKQVAFSCYSGLLYDGSTYFGTLSKNTSDIAVLVGKSANGNAVVKRFENGQWDIFRWTICNMQPWKLYRLDEKYDTKNVYCYIMRGNQDLHYNSATGMSSRWYSHWDPVEGKIDKIISCEGLILPTGDGQPWIHLPYTRENNGILNVNASSSGISFVANYECHTAMIEAVIKCTLTEEV